jgi:protein tyrosine kinase modulator
MLGHRELTIDDYLEILRRRYWILLLTAILGSAGTYLFSRVLPNQYLSRTLVLVQQPKVDEKFVTPIVSEQTNERLESMREEILSTAQLQPVADQFHIPLGLLRKQIVITPVQPIENTPWVLGFTIQVTLNDPRLAQQICAQVTSMFLEQNARWRAQVTQDTTNFLSKQIDDAKHALDEQDAQLTAFKLQYLGKLPDDAQSNMNLLMSYNSQLEAVTEAIARAQQDKVYLESQLTQQLAAWKATRSGSNALTLEEQLADLQNKLVMLRARYTDDYPDVIKLKSDIAHLQKKINASKAEDKADDSKEASNTPAYAEPSQIQQLRRQIHQYDETIQERNKQLGLLQKKIDAFQASVQLSPVIEQKYTEMTRDYKTALEFYRNLLNKKAQADMGADLERRQQSADFRVIDPASYSSLPASPNRLMFAGGGAAGGLFLGIAIALWLELRDKFIRTEQDVEFYLQVPTLALVPMVDKQSSPRNAYLPSGLTGSGDGTVKEISGG